VAVLRRLRLRRACQFATRESGCDVRRPRSAPNVQLAKGGPVLALAHGHVHQYEKPADSRRSCP
jgi:hypothetical protein